MSVINKLTHSIVVSCLWATSVFCSLNEPYQQIEDYGILVNSMDWSSYLNHYREYNPNIESLRLLDIGCGTGRWLKAFQNKLKDKLHVIMKCDLLDPSQLALQEAVSTLSSPLFLEKLIKETVQNAELELAYYDIIWAMHSFYSIPKTELPNILEKCIHSLKEHGNLFIGLTSNKSFYIQFYDLFRSFYSINQIESYTSAEMIMEAFQSLGMETELVKIEYFERIPVEDISRLNHYLLNECVGYSFDRDDNITSTLILTDILNHPKIGAFLRSFIVNDHYEFPQEIWLIKWSKNQYVIQLS